jgi:hypothetical protein
MGGLAGQFSTLTSSDFCPVLGRSPLFRPIPGGSSPRSYIFTQRSSSSSTRLPSGTASIISSIAGSTVPTSLDSSKSAPPPDLVQLQTPAPLLTIKDKPSDMGSNPLPIRPVGLKRRRSSMHAFDMPPTGPGNQSS